MKPAPKRKPLRIRGKLVIVDDDSSDSEALAKAWPRRKVLAIPSEMAFGTGDHPTTATCLRFLSDVADTLASEGKKWDMLDLGCGSGILALAARLMGASSALGLDFDPAAVRIAKQNAGRNHVDKVRFGTEDVLGWSPPRQWPVVAANLFSTILILAMPVLRQCVAPGGVLLLSGILHEQSAEVFAKAETCGFVIKRRLRKGKWVSARARG
jgi:ribosomal protein L11 methyltransferase